MLFDLNFETTTDSGKCMLQTCFVMSSAGQKSNECRSPSSPTSIEKLISIHKLYVKMLTNFFKFLVD